MNVGNSVSVISVTAVITISFIIGFIAVPKLSTVEIAIKSSYRSSIMQLFTGSICCLIPLTLSFIAYYPGGMNLDAVGQWWQVQDHFLDDWPPFMSTIIIFLVSKIWNNFAFYIFVQLMAFSFSMGFLSFQLDKYGIPRILNNIFMLYVGLSPATLTIVTCMYKDTQFAVLAVLITCFLVAIYNTKGEWLNKKTNIILLVISLTTITFVRHNGFFFSVPVILLLFTYKKSGGRLLL